MTQMTINIENPTVIPQLRRMITSFKGVSIASPRKKKYKCGLDEAIDDLRNGRVTHYESVDDMFKAFGI